jgi:hypothetical protein
MTKRVLAGLLTAAAFWPAMAQAQVEEMQRAPETAVVASESSVAVAPQPQVSPAQQAARAERQAMREERRAERAGAAGDGGRRPDRWAARPDNVERAERRRGADRPEVAVGGAAPEVQRWDAGRPRDRGNRDRVQRQRGFGGQSWGTDQGGFGQDWGRDRRREGVDGQTWSDRSRRDDRRWRDRDARDDGQSWGDDRRWRSDRWDDDRRRDDDRRWQGGRGRNGGRAWGNDGGGRDWRWDDPRSGYDWGWNDGRDRGWSWDGRQDWNRGWRNDDRFDWNRFRQLDRAAFRLPRYAPPFGWTFGYRRFGIGAALAPSLWAQDFWLDDPWAFRLPPAFGPYRWVRYFNDVLLVDLRSGIVVDAVHGIFW